MESKRKGYLLKNLFKNLCILCFRLNKKYNSNKKGQGKSYLPRSPVFAYSVVLLKNIVFRIFNVEITKLVEERHEITRVAPSQTTSKIAIGIFWYRFY
jgi:hypothetical protein